MTKRFSLANFGVPGIVLGVLIGLVIGFGAGEGINAAQGAQVSPPAAQGAQPATSAQPAPAAQTGQRGRGQRGPATPPAPCGPNIAGDLGKNTARDSRCFELRMYTVDPTRDGVGQFKGGIDDLHKRFREGEVQVFEKSGVQVLAVWQNLDDPNTLIYLLAYKDRAARDAGWAAFNADPKWTELRTKYFVPLNARAIMMSATDYSPMK